MSDKPKHYVVLEFEALHDGNVENIPWAEVLNGSVTVTNFKHLNKRTFDEFKVNVGVGNVLSEAEGMTCQQVVDKLNDCHDAGESIVPEEIVIWEPYEHHSVKEVLDVIENHGDNIFNEVVEFLQIDASQLK